MYEDGFSNTLQDLHSLLMWGSHQTLAMESLVCSALLDLQPSFIIFTDTVQTLSAFFHFTIWLLKQTHIYPHTPHNTNFSRHSHVLFYNIKSWQIVPQSGICLWAWGNREYRSDVSSLCYRCVPYHLINTETKFLQNNSFPSNSRKKNLHRCRAEHVLEWRNTGRKSEREKEKESCFPLHWNSFH